MSSAIMQPDPAFGTVPTVMSPSWRQALPGLAFAWAALFVLTLREWGEMAWQWWNSDSYAHILLIPPIIAWLAWMRMRLLRRMHVKQVHGDGGAESVGFSSEPHSFTTPGRCRECSLLEGCKVECS